MSNVSILNGIASWNSSVAGYIEAVIVESELISQQQFHLHTDKGTYLFNVLQWTFNEQFFSTSDSAITYLQTL